MGGGGGPGGGNNHIARMYVKMAYFFFRVKFCVNK